MTITYKVTEFEDDKIIEETKTETVTTTKKYGEKALLSEIARLQLILNEFPK